MHAHEEREWKTRKTRIDGRLQAQGWEVVPFDASRPLATYNRHAIEEFPTDNGPADYVLVSNGRILAVVEAKKLSLGPQNVLLQAERYSRGLSQNPFNFDGFHVPFLYATNGEVIWFHDIRHDLNRSRQIKEFHIPSALEEMLTRDFESGAGKLKDLPNNHPRLRPYQIEANAAVEKAIVDRKRQMLVAMATGTGKTFTTVNQVYRLMKSGMGQRILFLVDRRALAAQAVRAFNAFEPEPARKFGKIYEVYSQRFQKEDFDENEKFNPELLPKQYLEDPKPGQAFVYVCTIQRMAINLFGRMAVFGDERDTIDEDAEQLKIPIHAFDLIIADECHRGYTSAELSVWRNTLDHFDAIKVGLTATPAAHSKAYFHDVVYRYEYERAVREGYLVDYDAVTIKSNVRINGIFLQEGEQVRLVDTTSGAIQLDLLEDERQYDSSDIEQKITAPDSNRKIIEEVRKYALEHQAKYGRFPKTLIFAQNDLPHRSHADQLVNICRDVFGQGDSFVQKITGTTTDRPLQRIREFRNRPLPAVVVSVDMLTTGVDIPDLEFIVFLRPVKSRILFEQMLGRGTRKGEKYHDKSHFVVFDCFDGTLLNYFKTAAAFTAEPPDKPSRTIQEVIEQIWQNRDREYNVRCLVKRLQRINKEMSGDAREQFAPYIADGDMGQFAKELPSRISRSFTDTMKLLRDDRFAELLVNYKRPKKTFIVADAVEDVVASEWLIRGATGKEYKPEDYLTAFARFVRDNPDKIDAIQILLYRPKAWGTDALTELRAKLKAAPERFTEENLQKAHKALYSKALVEIISMVKYAANTMELLLTAEERVDRAVTKITAGRSLTPEQAKWMDRIRHHLITNLSISQDDFDLLPIFEREGGWGRANRVFEGKLNELILELNEAIAA